MNAEEIIGKFEDSVAGRGCFIVDVSVTADNDVTVTVESEESTVTLDDCVALSGDFEHIFNRDEEDYSLTVSSAGLDQPFRTQKQYVKAVGKRVEVQLKGGRKFTATLNDVNDNGIRLSYSSMEPVEGKKRKQLVEHDEFMDFTLINSVRPFVDFE